MPDRATVGLLNNMAEDIRSINEDHGFYTPVPKTYVDAAERGLEEIGEIGAYIQGLRKRRDAALEADGDVTLVTSHELGFRHLKLMLIITEVCEILDAQTREEHDEEVADVFIRLLDYVAATGVDLDRSVYDKMEKNRNRPYMHGRKF